LFQKRHVIREKWARISKQVVDGQYLRKGTDVSPKGNTSILVYILSIRVQTIICIYTYPNTVLQVTLNQ